MSFKTRRQKSSSSSATSAKRSERLLNGNTVGEDVRSVQSMISDDFGDHTYMGCQIIIGSYTDEETGEEEPSFSGMLIFEKNGKEQEATAGISTGQGREGQTTGAPLHNALYTAFIDAGGFEADEDKLIDACTEIFHDIMENGLLEQELQIGLFEDSNGDFSDKFFVGKRRIGAKKRRLRGGAASKPAPTNSGTPERGWKKADIVAWLNAEGDTAADTSMTKDELMGRVDEI